MPVYAEFEVSSCKLETSSVRLTGFVSQNVSFFLDHGEIEISNNQVENAIRPVVNGRKNWLFADTPEGAEALAIVYTLMETAKANNLRLENYTEYLLTVMPERLSSNPDADIDDLLPWADGMQKQFAMFRTGD